MDGEHIIEYGIVWSFICQWVCFIISINFLLFDIWCFGWSTFLHIICIMPTYLHIVLIMGKHWLAFIRWIFQFSARDNWQLAIYVQWFDNLGNAITFHAEKDEFHVGFTHIYWHANKTDRQTNRRTESKTKPFISQFLKSEQKECQQQIHMYESAHNDRCSWYFDVKQLLCIVICLFTAFPHINDRLTHKVFGFISHHSRLMLHSQTESISFYTYTFVSIIGAFHMSI